MFLACRVDRI